MLKECPSCHNQFITSVNYQYCKFCFKEYIESQKAERQKIEDAKWLIQKNIEKAQFENDLKSWSVVDLDCIHANNPLYIIGNGFDLLHKAKSSYYDFRDSMGKNNHLRWCLETYLKAENLWSNFEEALGHLDVSTMASIDIVDMWLDNYEAYDEDSSAADFFAAAETAAGPVVTIANELPRAFRRWIESVVLPTSDRPLVGLIKNAPVLNFNYTEFIETLYGVDHNNVCYIHGCRKKIKGKPKDKLILGHMPGANGSEYKFRDKWRPKNPYKRQMVDIGQEIAIEHIFYCDDELTKHCDEIVKEHRAFFDGLNVTDVIVIGHSLSEVDWDYFEEIVRDNNNLNWYISCYGLGSLKSIEKFVQKFSIKSDKVHLFRLDGIRVTVDPVIDNKKDIVPKKRILCKTDKWDIQEFKGKLIIYENGTKCYSLIFPGFIRKAIQFDKYLMVVCDEVYLLKYDSEDWKFVRELEPIQNQSLLNSRLDRILYDKDILIFVYNNRIRKYNLENGKLIENKAMRNAREMNVSGKIVEFR